METVDALLTSFFARDDLDALTAQAAAMLGCPILILDDTFHVFSSYCPLDFTDALFRKTLLQGELTFEVSAAISQSRNLAEGKADFFKPEGSPFRRRIGPLVSTGVRLGYLVCPDIDGHLARLPEETWAAVERILAKQLFIETSRQDKPFETAEDILMHLLDGGFPNAAYFRLQTAGTYLADFHPAGFALLDLTGYPSQHPGREQLKEAVLSQFPQSHPFLYRGDVFLFLAGKEDFSALALEFRLKIAVSEGLSDLYDLPARYRTAREALALMGDERYHGESVCTVDRLRVPLMLKNLEGRGDLVSRPLRALADHDREKGTGYCETLYWYLACGRSLKKTCEVLFTHRNTVLYRIRRMQGDFGLPLDDPACHAELLLGVSVLLFRDRGPDFFLR